MGKLSLTQNQKDKVALKLNKKIIEYDIVKDLRNDFTSKRKIMQIALNNLAGYKKT